MLTNSLAFNCLICFNTYCLWIHCAHCTVLLFLDFFSIQLSSSEFTKALSAVLFFTCGVNCFVQFNNSPKRQIPHTPMHTTARCIDALTHSKHPNMNALRVLCILCKSNLPTTAHVKTTKNVSHLNVHDSKVHWCLNAVEASKQWEYCAYCTSQIYQPLHD